MVQGSPVLQSIENNFTKGLVTEFTGLNFPENAATDCDNCQFTLIGDTLRRQGIKAELNGTTFIADRTGQAVSEYKWNNVGGDGLTQVLVRQIGATLYFYKSSIATVLAPISTTKLASTVTLSSFTVGGGSFDTTVECQYSDGNGYLFVYHPSMDPIYCSYVAGVITGVAIVIKTRDFSGVIDAWDINNRPTTLDNEHLYNLQNQGWTKGSTWTANSLSTQSESLGSKVFIVAAGIAGVTVGDNVTLGINSGFFGFVPGIMSGTVTAYVSTSLTINVTALDPTGSGTFSNWVITPSNKGYITTWNTAVGNYPSNSDVWWYFKNASNVFDPATTKDNVTYGLGRAPRGHFILNAFSQARSSVSATSGLTDVSTTTRPRTGCWFQGRVWYTGVDAAQQATGDADFFTWTENLYFSQIVKTPADFSACYQLNDPTSENLFGLLPTDGGVITIQGCGSIYKLWPLQNALLVFASNGIWYVTGTQGVGFAANDYTIIKLSSIRSISGTSFVDVQGLPYFWNEEGIYSVEPNKQGQLPNTSTNLSVLQVNPITVGTILSFYNSIPFSSKKYVRGAYHPIDYTIQWVYRDTEAANVTQRYSYNKILNFNVYNKSFYPFTIDNSASSINGILYVEGPGGTGSPLPTLKYLYSNGTATGFAEEYDTSYVDWGSINYHSYFVTGYKIHGQGQRRFQIPYIYLYSRVTAPVSYFIQSVWDFAVSGNTGRWSAKQLKNITDLTYGVGIKRHRLRGRGLALQIKVSSVDGQPFDIMGWSAFEVQNLGI